MKDKYDPFKDSCRDCVSFLDNPPRCTVKEYVFQSEESMQATGSSCWAFCCTKWKSTDPDQFITQQTKAKEVK